MTEFELHCNDIAKEYIQTVLIIDDGAGLQNELVEAADEISDIEEDIFSDSPETLEPNISAEDGKDEKVQQDPEESSHPLRTLALTKAFHELGIVAGLFQPQLTRHDDPEQFASKAILASAAADIIILDWMLRDHDSRFSKYIVKNILAKDSCSGGRFRTILIYTGESNLTNLRDELFTFLNNENLKKDVDFELRSENLNITFYNKKDTLASNRIVEEEALPLKAITDFAKLIDGLMPAFAMKAAAAIRLNAGKVATRFSSNLDTGYLSHRVLLPEPYDAEVFILENYISYIRNILAISQIDKSTLGVDAISSWVDHNSDKLEKTVNFGANKCTLQVEDIKAIASNGFSEHLQAGVTKANPQLGENFSDPKKSCFVQAVSMFNFVDGVTSEESSISLSELACFRRTYKDLHAGQSPYLTQGSLIYSLSKNEFLLCITPKCDTVRVDESSKFSFAVLERKILTQKFDLIVPVMDEIVANITQKLKVEVVDLCIEKRELSNPGLNTKKIDEIEKWLKIEGYVCLSTSEKFFKLEHIDFFSDSNKRVNTNLSVGGNLAFWDKDVNEYIWIGDLEDLDSQKRVSKLVGNLNRVGNDEVEWLRRKNS